MTKKLNSPIILIEGKYSEKDLNNLKEEYKIWQINDIYKLQLGELFEILNPDILQSKDFSKKQKEFVNAKVKKKNSGNWIYLPWDGHLIHCLNENDYFLLRTNRNKLLITQEEQEKLNKACVGLVGLSIGSHFALSLTYSGIANSMKLAEFDAISTSNLNRIRAGIKDINVPKLDFISQEIYGLNPYADLSLFKNGLNDSNLGSFFNKGKKLNVIFEAIDDFEMKIKVRIEARKQRVPVIMLTNLGDNLLIDVERYDMDSKLILFNGLIGDTPEEILNSKITEEKKIKFAVNIVGKEHLSERIMETLLEINKTLVGRPQLFSTVSVGGGFAAYLARKLILEQGLKSGRYFVSFDQFISRSNNSKLLKSKDQNL